MQNRYPTRIQAASSRTLFSSLTRAPSTARTSVRSNLTGNSERGLRLPEITLQVEEKLLRFSVLAWQAVVKDF